MSASAVDVGALAVLTVGAIVALRQLPRLWNHESAFWDQKPNGFVWSDAVWAGWVRAALVSCCGGLAMIIAGWTLVLGSPSTVTKAIVIVFFLGMFMALGLAMLIVLFNWPKLLVPPHLRGEPGVLGRR